MAKKGKPKRKAGFANARVQALIRNVGAFRISADATYRLNEILTSYAMTIARYANDIAKHNGRKTVQENDIKLAATK
ncbi:MAG: histone [Candidatus Hodarchaeales archaeon]|jgi:histone H3/H4